MGDVILAQLKWRDGSKMMMMGRNSTFNDIVVAIKGEWPSIKGSKFRLTYSCGDVKNCSISCNDDISNMIIAGGLLGVKMISVDVMVDNYVCPGNVGSGFRLSPIQTQQTNDTQQEYRRRVVDDVTPSAVGSTSGGREWTNDQLGLFAGLFKSKALCNQGNQEFAGEGRLPKYGVWPNIAKQDMLSDPWKHIITGNAQEFRGGAAEFRDSLVKYTIKSGFKFNYRRNGPRYIEAHCANREGIPGCAWVVKGKRQLRLDDFIIYDSNLKHNCVGNVGSKVSNRMSAVSWGKLLVEQVKADLTFGGHKVKIFILTYCGIVVMYSQAWRALERARDTIFGIFNESYNELVWYCVAITKTNPGSIALIEAEPDSSQFKRLFVAFKACIDGFKYCRPMLFVDGTFMNVRRSGVLLSATAKDGDNGLFPVAMVVVSSETLDNWTWFLQLLKDHVHHDLQIFYISDRNCGLLSAFEIVFDEPCHFYCLTHLLANLKTLLAGGRDITYRKKICERFKEAAYAPTVSLFDEKIEAFKAAGGQKVVDWLENCPTEKWALAHSSHITRYGEMTSNASESFNFWILDARSLPVTCMIDYIRIGIMRWFVERRKESSEWSGVLCPKKENEFGVLSELCAGWNILQCPGGEFEVISQPSVRVEIDKHTCTCYQWQVTGFPCVHAVAVIRRQTLNIENVVLPAWFAKAYRQSYQHDIHSVPQSEKFEYTESADEKIVLPPPPKRKMGRPKKDRYKPYPVKIKVKPSACPVCLKVVRHDEFTCALKNRN